ncbi:MAG: DNA/RNA non-specific endonuclease [Bdellovibrionales bacterium]|nr:DNA/RNA non-specific endonuclease [Bdellovibrionales bacterium]
MKIRLTIATATLIVLSGCRGTQTIPDASIEAPPPELPAVRIEETPAKPEARAPIVERSRLIPLNEKYFEVQYDPGHRMAKYVKYTVTAAQLRLRHGRRRDNFHPDRQLPEKLQVRPKEYAKSGYDKGHLAPAADFSFSQEAIDSTFVMSNMAPQKPDLNRRAWQALEARVRRWACGESKVTVITGPIFEKEMPRLKSGLVIPPQFFKIVIDETPPRKVLAFVYNQGDRDPKLIDRRTVPIRQVLEKIQETFESEIGEPIRQPSQISLWKEEEC